MQERVLCVADVRIQPKDAVFRDCAFLAQIERIGFVHTDSAQSYVLGNLRYLGISGKPLQPRSRFGRHREIEIQFYRWCDLWLRFRWRLRRCRLESLTSHIDVAFCAQPINQTGGQSVPYPQFLLQLCRAEITPFLGGDRHSTPIKIIFKCLRSG